MKRTNKIPDLILCSDFHLREDTPVCRTDDFWKAQWDKVEQVMRLQEKYECPIVHAGDLFDHWKASPYLLTKAIEELMPFGRFTDKKRFYTIVGNHDVPQHNVDLLRKSGINVLEESRSVIIIRDFDKPGGFFGSEHPADLSNSIDSDVDEEGNLLSDDEIVRAFGDRRVAVWHKFVWDGKNIPWPGYEGKGKAKSVLKKYPEFDLIVTGDNHKPFVTEYKGRILVNPGCLTRQAADFADFKPRVYLWYADTNTVKPYYLEIEDNVVSREHIEDKEKRDKRIDAFVSRLSDEWKVGTSFEENLERCFDDNKIRKEVKELVYKAIEEE